MANWLQIVAQALPTVIGATGAIFGGRKAKKERRKMDEYLNRQEADNQSWYNENALGDYTQRAESQAMLRQMRDTLAAENKKAAAMNVVTGATPDTIAAQKASANKAIGDVYSNLSVMGQQYKDNVTNQYMARKDAITDQRLGLANTRANNYEDIMGNGINLAANGIMSLLGQGGALDDLFGKTKKAAG